MVRPRVAGQVREAFWSRVAGGASIEVAAFAVGVSRATGYRWFAASGGVIPAHAVREPLPVSSSSHGRRLSIADREEIAYLRRRRWTITA
ncbi:Integrase catalytic region, partial [Nocardioides sp. PD653-B2]